MYIVKTGNPKISMFSFRKKQIIKELIPHIDTPSEEPQLAEIDMTQSGSGMKGIRNKMKLLDLHSGAKKKYNKFISLKL